MMRNIMKKTASIVLAAALVVSLAPANADAAKKVKLSSKSKTIAVKKSFTLKVKNGSKKAKVTWKTSNKKVAALSKQVKKGNKASVKVTGKKKGSAKITATYKLGKKKTKLTCKVTVGTVAPTAAPTTAATVAPTAAPTIAATVAPTTAAPSATPAKTQKPKKTAGPTATPTPEPTKPPMADVSAPYVLPFNENTVQTQNNASYVINDDGTVTISVAEKYSGIGFCVPADLEDNNFDTVTVKYKDATNIGDGFGCGFWRMAGSSDEDKSTESVMAWAGIFASTDENGALITEGEWSATLGGSDVGSTFFVNKALFFNNTEALTADNQAVVTIESVIFSHSEYNGPARPTPTPGEGEGTETTPTPAPELPDAPVEPLTAEMVDAAFTVDGTVEEAWDAIKTIDFAGKHEKGELKSTSTATAKLAWDADKLYGLVEVVDPSIDATNESNSHERDGVEFFLDEDNCGLAHVEQNWDGTNWAMADGFQYRFTGFTSDDATKVTKGFAGGTQTARDAYAGIEAEYTLTETGYIVEFSIPFTSQKTAGTRVGFDAVVQDCSEGARNAELYLNAVTGEMSYWNNMVSFPELVLVDSDAPLTAKKVDAAFTIDGTVDEGWAAINAVPFSSRAGSGEVPAADIATAKLAWDANNLYGLVVVNDSDIDSESPNDWERDGIEFFLDEDNCKLTGSYDTANLDAFQYRFTGLTTDAEGKAAAPLTNRIVSTAREQYSGIEAAYIFTKTGYIVEFKIPFTAAKEAGAVVGFDAIVMDCAGGSRAAEIFLNPTEASKAYYNNSVAFPELTLVD